ncbi:MAG: hypothetical protein KGO96_11240 [Elusimicrobia bacterium]|nr:hypothetical protein [Elusimicrobiota bacterium]MDE2426466.1 hypothetical protein [Elusimicrobiota bacterium]
MELTDLSYEQLFELHEQVVMRLRYLADLRARAVLDRYQVGDRIRFDDGRGRVVAGRVARINRKSLTVETPKGRWSGIPPYAVTEHVAKDKPCKPLESILRHAR